MLTVPLERGGAIQLARSLESTNDVLARLRWVLLALVLGGIALAAALGRLAARHLVAPVVRVTEAARHIEETEDLGRRIEVTSQDEVGELAARFNAMLDTLEGSIAAQRQLVADASHELRTPVTSLRTNIEVLAENRLDGAERARLVADVQAQAEELSALVADLIELARGDQPSPVREDVRLDALVAEAVERARRHAPDVTVRDRARACGGGRRPRPPRARGQQPARQRGPPRATRFGERGPSGVRVSDDGGGIAPDDLPHIFDRFYRGADARGRPGTGLGLAIVRQVAEQHGGSVRAANEGGGASVRAVIARDEPQPRHLGSGSPSIFVSLPTSTHSPRGSLPSRGSPRAAGPRRSAPTARSSAFVADPPQHPHTGSRWRARPPRRGCDRRRAGCRRPAGRHASRRVALSPS